ncbi:uncharacterized protein [Antedon mediterranea]|uniref:uncharacterized protein n=1 Tax=Antedon mediterranea TaxID=105859 RepID=UPI003AF897B8
MEITTFCSYVCLCILLLMMRRCSSVVYTETECITDKGTINCLEFRAPGFHHEIRCLNKDLHEIPRCNPNVESLNLRKNHIEDLSKGLDHYLSLKVLNLENNRIKSVAIEWNHMSSLKELVLPHNRISSLEDNAFKGLSAIQEINLSSNRLMSIGNSTFQDTVTLSKLYLGNNSLSSIPWRTFYNTELSVLDLSRNKLEHISPQLFHYCPHLMTLNLRYNWLTEFPAVFVKVFPFELFDLSDNVFECNCNENTFELSDSFSMHSCEKWKDPTCRNGKHFRTLRTQCSEKYTYAKDDAEDKAEFTHTQDGYHSHDNDPLKIVMILFMGFIIILFVTQVICSKLKHNRRNVHAQCEHCVYPITESDVTQSNDDCRRVNISEVDAIHYKCVQKFLNLNPFNCNKGYQHTCSTYSETPSTVTPGNQHSLSSLVNETHLSTENQQITLPDKTLTNCPHHRYFEYTSTDSFEQLECLTCSAKTSIV